MKALIIEDEARAREHMKNLLSQHFPAAEVVGAIGSVKEAVEWLMANPDPDVIFMDVELSDGLSFDIFNKIEVNSPVIMTTAYDQYAIQAFEVNAVDYLLKPFGFQEFQRAANRLKERCASPLPQSPTSSNEDILFLKSDYRIVKVSIPEIRYIEGMSEYLKVWIEGQPKPVITLLSMKKMEERLPDYFMRIHRSYIVNLTKIQEVNKNRIIMDANSYLPIGDLYKETFQAYLNNRFFK